MAASCERLAAPVYSSDPLGVASEQKPPRETLRYRRPKLVDHFTVRRGLDSSAVCVLEHVHVFTPPDDAQSHAVCALLLMSRLWCRSRQRTVCCHGEGRLVRNMRQHVQVPAAAAAETQAAAPLPLVCTAATDYINHPASPLCHSAARGEKFSKARP